MSTIVMRKFINRTEEYLALVHSEDSTNENLAFFIHGFKGNYLSTWGELPDLLKVNADSYPEFKTWDYLFLGYKTRKISSYLDIAYILCDRWNAASNGDRPFMRKYKKLALFGHSLGTLGIRQLLCAWSIQPVGMKDAIQSITLFGTPLNGSPYAHLASFIGYSIADALKPHNPQLRMLKTWTESAYDISPWRDVEIILGQQDQVVGTEYAELIQWVGDKNPQHTSFDHSELVKPTSWQNSRVIEIISTALKTNNLNTDGE